jgi:hypothetical protein
MSDIVDPGGGSEVDPDTMEHGDETPDEETESEGGEAG